MKSDPSTLVATLLVLSSVHLTYALLVPISQKATAAASATLNASYIPYTTDSQSPPDVTVGPIYGTCSNYASAFVTQDVPHLRTFTSQASSSPSSTITPSSVAVTVSSTFSWGPSVGIYSSSTASGNVTFQLTEPTTFNMLFSPGGYATTSVELDSNSTQLWHSSWSAPNNPPTYPPTLLLNPGQYQLLYNYTAQYLAGTGGPGSMSFSMSAAPEPASLALLSLAALPLLTRRRP